MTTAEEIVVKLTAQTAELKAGMAEGAAVVKTTQDEMAASMATSVNAFRQFDDITKQSVQSTEGLAEAQKALQAAQASGAFTTEELAVKEALVADAMRKVGTETKAASGLLSMFTRNSRTMYSTSALITDDMTGQFSRMRREVAALGNETGLMAKAFQFAVSPIGLTIAAVAALGAVAIEGANNWADLRETVIATNGALGLSAEQLQALATAAQFGNQTMGDAREAMEKLAASGRFTGEQLELATSAAVDLGNITGQNADKAGAALLRMATDPQRELIALNNQYGILTVAQAQDIENLIKQGNQSDAFTLALQDVNDGLKKLAKNVDDARSPLGQLWDVSIRGLSTFMFDLEELLDGDDLRKFWNNAAEGYNKYAKLISEGTLGMVNLGQVGTWGDAGDASGADGEASAQGKQKQKTAVAGVLKPGRGGGGVSGLEQQFKEQEAAAHASYDQMKVDAADFWNAQATDAKNSAAVQADAWEKYIAARHQLDEQGIRDESEAGRKATEAARKAAEIAKQVAEGRARAEKQADDEIAAEAKKDADARRQAALTDAQTARTIADAKIAKAKQDAQTEYDQGKITAPQLLQIQNDLVQQKLAAELAYLKAKQTLDAGDVNAEKQDAAQITAARLKAQTEQSANLDKSLKQDEAKWKQYSQRIAGAMQNAVNAMLFQHQTLRSSLASIGESIAETFIEAVVDKPMQTFIAGEGEKLAAAIGFGTQNTAQQETQRAINTSADIADKTAAAVRAAGLAGAQGVASFAAAPWPIDLGAPAFGAVMFAEAMAFGSMASAAGGWERVPADGMLTQLRKDEMVLPAHIAEPMRKMTRNGGGSGVTHNHFHVQSWDSRDLGRFVRSHGGALSTAMSGLRRNGYR